MRNLLVCYLSLALLLPTAAFAEAAFRTETLLDGLEHPWAIAFLPDGDWLITERPGHLRHVRNGRLREQPVSGVPEVSVGGQGGLLDIVLHPDFDENQWVYLSWSQGRDDGRRTTAVGRGQWRDGGLHNFETLLEADAWSRKGQHFGGRLLFDDDGYLYLTVGDRGSRDRAQNPHDHVGSVLRLTDTGKPAPGNPFAGKKRGADEVWTYGHRNPQGMALHPQTREIWTHEHGPRGGDEINVLRAGNNYGWPKATYGREYSGPKIGPETAPGTEPPLKQWTPSIAPSGLTIYSGDAFPDWRNDLFVGALSHRHIARVRFDGTNKVEEEKLLNGEARMRDVRTGPDGLIYLLTDEGNGRLLRLRPAE